MASKRIFQSIVVVAMLAASFASTGSALAWRSCSNQVTVQWGDTLSGIAAAWGTTVDAIRATNPGLGWWLYAGQVLCMPTGYSAGPIYYPPPMGGSTYVVQWGDTLGNIAVRYGVSLGSVVAVNPQIWNPSLIYPGQVINLPYGASLQPVVYYPTPIYPTPVYPVPTVAPNSSVLKVTYKNGLLVRTGPGKNYGEIVSPLVSAVKNTNWRYRKDSVTVDPTGLVWVEVQLSPGVVGYSTGWILVRDKLGNYFTDPKINPFDP